MSMENVSIHGTKTNHIKLLIIKAQTKAELSRLQIDLEQKRHDFSMTEPETHIVRPI